MRMHRAPSPLRILAAPLHNNILLFTASPQWVVMHLCAALHDFVGFVAVCVAVVVYFQRLTKSFGATLNTRQRNHKQQEKSPLETSNNYTENQEPRFRGGSLDVDGNVCGKDAQHT